MARVPPPEAAGVPAHDTAPSRHLRLLHRPASRVNKWTLRSTNVTPAVSETGAETLEASQPPATLWANRRRNVSPPVSETGWRTPRSENRKIDRVGWDEWVRSVEVEPSLYAADFARLGVQI